MPQLLLALGAVALIAIAILYESFSFGFLLYKFWYWFIIPSFPQVPHITFYHAVGLVLVIGLFKTHDYSTREINGNEIKVKPDYIQLLIAPWVILIVGWFVHLFI